MAGATFPATRPSLEDVGVQGAWLESQRDRFQECTGSCWPRGGGRRAMGPMVVGDLPAAGPRLGYPARYLRTDAEERMMRVLVTTATKYGGTAEIAAAIAEVLDEHGLEVAVPLAGRPVWLFSSGPVGDPPKPEEDPVDVADLLAATEAREHRVFPGKLVRKQLSFPERAIVSVLRVPEGDFRDWTEIRKWAAGIADTLGAGFSPHARLER
jgi:menaquinone-dependent protoporphyrinogen IX oxidase